MTSSRTGAIAGLFLLGLAGPAFADADGELQQRAAAIFGRLPAVAESAHNPVTPAKVTLGRMLYFETRLSINNSQSCNTCHQLDRFGVDNEPTSAGHAGKRGDRNSPTSLNAAFHLAQFWDGRAPTVEEQAKGPILNPVEMGMPSAEEVVKRLKAIPGYPPLFQSAFPGEEDPVTYDNLALAIGAFERKLVSPAPFDDFVGGKLDALTAEQKQGLGKFFEAGCVACHAGNLLGGQMYQKLGLVKPYPTTDKGRAAVTGNEAENFFFKVPSLRNVAKTAPYLHDGSVATLPDMVKKMGEYQLGRSLTDEDTRLIVSFLDSLTGQVDADYVKAPKLPD